LKNYESTLSDLQQGLKLAPKDLLIPKKLAATYYSLGIESLRESHVSMAQDYFHQSIELDPTVPEFYFERAKIYYWKEDIEACVRDLSKVLELRPGDGGALALLSTLNPKGNRPNLFDPFPAHSSGSTGLGRFYRPTSARSGHSGMTEEGSTLKSLKVRLQPRKTALKQPLVKFQLKPSPKSRPSSSNKPLSLEKLVYKEKPLSKEELLAEEQTKEQLSVEFDRVSLSHQEPAKASSNLPALPLPLPSDSLDGE
jgi:tetratricopeptide (TPR) repeat protein